MDVILVLAVAEVMNCVDACDNSMNEFVGVHHCWISDVLMLELDIIAQSFAPCGFNMVIVSAIVFRQSIQIPTVN